MTYTFVTFENPLTKLLSPKDPPFCRNKNIDSFGLSSSKYSIEGGRSDLKENLPLPNMYVFCKFVITTPESQTKGLGIEARTTMYLRYQGVPRT